MTVNFEFVNKLRDVLVAEQVGKKAALGYFEVEFTIYGCAYYIAKEDMVYYKLSSKAQDIYQYSEQAQLEDIFAGNIESITLKCQVPLGEQETIEMQVKKKLALQLKQKYPKEFFVRLGEIAQKVQNNSAVPTLWEIAAEIEGHFAENQLQEFAGLVHYTYRCRKIKHAEYERLLNWLAEENDNMLDITVSKDVGEKTLYGIAYAENDSLKYVANAQLDYVLKKAESLETQGLIVSPVWQRQYFYNYNSRQAEMMKKFKTELGLRYSKLYMTELKNLRSWGVPDSEIIALGIDACPNEACEHTLKRYAARWGAAEITKSR